MAHSSVTALPPRADPARAAVRAWLLAIGLGSVAALAIALVSQHAFDIQPCPWCVIQRIVTILVAAVAFAGAAGAGRSPRAAAWVAGPALLALAVGGVVAAWYQHTVAAKQFSCSFTWADRTLMWLQLDAWLPSVFQVGATCADAAKALLLGQPYEAWSGAWFVLTAIAALAAMAAALRARR